MQISYQEFMQKVSKMEDRFDLRLKMVQHARVHGIKPAARHYQTAAGTVRKGLNRYGKDARKGLVDRSRAPKRPAHRIASEPEARIVELKTRYPLRGAKHLKYEFDLPCAHVAVLRGYRQHGLSTRNRPRRHHKRKDLRDLKATWAAFQQVVIDTRPLNDLPHYRPPAVTLGLPKYQHTARDAATGWMALGFTHENTSTAACCFVDRLGRHLIDCGIDLSQTVWQSDNGSEFKGCCR